jgi:hypothetical protein
MDARNSHKHRTELKGSRHAHYANVIDELVGEPVLPAAEQIARARDAVMELERKELDELMADLIEHPTVRHGGSGGRRAAHTFYAPRM